VLQQEDTTEMEGYPTIELGSMHVVSMAVRDGQWDVNTSDNLVCLSMGELSESEESSIPYYDAHSDENYIRIQNK
jgi:hypothetical protein